MPLAQEITERRFADEAYRTIVRTAMDGFWLADTQGRILDVNDAYCRLLGYSREELLNMRIQDVEAVESAEEVMQHIRRVMEVGQDRFETRHRRKDGRIVDIEVSVNYMDVEGDRLFVFLRDITERKQTIQAVEESEKRYRLLAEHVSDVIWVTDMKLRPTYISPSYASLTGYSIEEAMDRGTPESLPPASLRAATEAFKRATEQGEQASRAAKNPPLELELICKDGHTVLVDTAVNFIHDSDGQPIAMLGILRDITGRKRAEQALRASEERLQAIVETTSDWVWEVDENAVYTYVSPKIRQILGYEPEEVLGKTPFDFMPSDEAARVKQAFGTIAASRKPFAFLENVNLHKSGQPVVLETSGVPIFSTDGGFRGYRGVDRDISERKKAEEAVRSSEERFRNLVESTSDCVWEVDEKAVYTYVSPRVSAILGYEPDEVLGKTMFDFMSLKEANYLTKIFQSAATSQQPLNFAQIVHLHKDGHEVLLETNGIPFFDTKRRLRGYRGIHRDMTRCRRAEQQVQQTLTKLSETVDGIIRVLATVVEMRDPDTAGHQRRVAQLACAIARELGRSTDEIQAIRVAGLLHDLGRMFIPADILAKPGRLTEAEFAIVKNHPKAAYDILKNVQFPWPIADIVLQHHERMDGSGYPSGLPANEIPVEARILGVADVVEAMTAHRPYRKAPGLDKALEEISQNSGRLYDSDVVCACLRLFTQQGIKFEENPSCSLASVV